MLIRELLNEGPELSSSIKNVNVHIGNIIGMVYNQLETMAQSFGSKTNAIKFNPNNPNAYSMKGFKKLIGSVKARWFHAYGNNFKAELYSLADQSGGKGKELKNFLFNPETGPNISKGGELLNTELAKILIKLGNAIDSPEMTKKAQQWIIADDKLKKLIVELEAELEKQGGDTVDEPVEPKQDKPKAPNTTSQQKSQAEIVVNQVLDRLPRDIAHAIRMKIAKSDNKLMALQQELKNRKIDLKY
jgi:hypothetical protein